MDGVLVLQQKTLCLRSFASFLDYTGKNRRRKARESKYIAGLAQSAKHLMTTPRRRTRSMELQPEDADAVAVALEERATNANKSAKKGKTPKKRTIDAENGNKSTKKADKKKTPSKKKSEEIAKTPAKNGSAPKSSKKSVKKGAARKVSATPATKAVPVGSEIVLAENYPSTDRDTPKRSTGSTSLLSACMSLRFVSLVKKTRPAVVLFVVLCCVVLCCVCFASLYTFKMFVYCGDARH